MKTVLEKWTGKYVVNGEVRVDLHDFNPKDGDDFHITLLSKNREIRDAEAEDLLQRG